MTAFTKLKGQATLVYVNSTKKGELESLSPLVYGSLRAGNMGSNVPKVVLSTPDQSQVLAKMPYLRLSTPQAFTTLQKIIDQAQTGKLPKPASDTTPIWLQKGGTSSYYGHFAKIETVNGKATLFITINKAGRTAQIPLAQLSEGAQAYAKVMAAAATTAQ
ncbi:hypothetical protein HW115_04935 [Verrucomicrobiaceae bacterium N1E253]|uniref:Uncharacterized protein n=1 Tax=Oceaniferula marina TaxID=2748318 RepID=A0A851GDC5_9BACT|nr:hypothetical protein [Oceaniferula marina]NWK54942.1 hypothetical protein [Oceaniferula marina]